MLKRLVFLVSFAGFFAGSVGLAEITAAGSRALDVDRTTITVSFHLHDQPADQRASGFLSLINSNTPDPPTDLVQPLKARLWKNAYDTNFERIVTQFQCPTVLTTLAEHWGLPSQSPPPWLDDQNPDWSSWDSFCRSRVNLYLDQGFNPVWNVWNEPDGSSRWWHGADGYANLAETYKHAYQSIRQAYIDHPVFGLDDMVIAAPGFADWSNAYGFHSGIDYWTGEPFEEGFSGFLQFCADNAIQCHVIMWHEFWEDHIFYIPVKAAIMKSLVEEHLAQNPEINVQRYYVDEMIHANWPYDRDYNLSPGHVATVLSLIEIAGLDGAVRAVWGDRYGFPGNINHSVASVLDVQFCEDAQGNPVLWPPPSYCHAEPYAPRSHYWVHWYYAQFEGTVATVETSYPVQSGFGTYDQARETFQVLLGYSLSYGYDGGGTPAYGYGTTSTIVKFRGLPVYENRPHGLARLTVLEIPPTGFEPLPSPLVVVDRQQIGITRGVCFWTLPEMRRGYAYVIKLTDFRPSPLSHAPLLKQQQ